MFSWYGWIFIVSLFVGGLYALAEMIGKKNKAAGDLIVKIGFLQGYVGVGLIVFSILNLIFELSEIGLWMQNYPLSEIIYLLSLLVGLVIGVLSAIDLLRSYKIVKEEVVNNIKAKLLMIKVPLGIAAIAVSLYLAVWGIVVWPF
jgi:hypothetical protein